jgi:hypothetical protein
MFLRVVAALGPLSILLASVACEAPVDDDAETEEAAATEDRGDESAAPQRPAPAPPEDEPESASVTTRVTRTGCTVTSSARDEDGSVYVTGTFVDSIRVGDAVLTSRGAEDVCLVKTAPDGTFAWAQSVGSDRRERAPSVTVQGRQVRIVGLTEGRMDCGDGPLPLWSADSFFFCVFGRHDGATVEGGTFPISSR